MSLLSKLRDAEIKLVDARATLSSILSDLTDEPLTSKGEEMVDFIRQTLYRTK